MSKDDPPRRLAFLTEDQIEKAGISWDSTRSIEEVVANDHFVREHLRTMNVRLREQNMLLTDVVRLARDMQENQPIQVQILDCMRDIRSLMQGIILRMDSRGDPLVVAGAEGNGHDEET